MQAGRWLEQERTRRKCIFNGDRSTIGNSKDVYMMLEFDKKVENYDAVEATSTNVDEGKNGNSSTPVSSNERIMAQIYVLAQRNGEILNKRFFADNK